MHANLKAMVIFVRVAGALSVSWAMFAKGRSGFWFPACSSGLLRCFKFREKPVISIIMTINVIIITARWCTGNWGLTRRGLGLLHAIANWLLRE